MIAKNNITKLIVANFFTGMVLWYGIEKLFMQQIGISPLGVGVNAAVFLLITVLFDVPSGVLADRWNRKYVLLLAMTSLMASTFVLGASSGLLIYLFGTVLYGFYIVLASGTFQAIMYDSLHEIGLEKQYDTYQGRAYAMFLLGIAISSLAGGYVSEWYGYQWAYFISLLFVFVSFVCIATVKEPKFHKLHSDTKLLQHIAISIKGITSNAMVLQLALFVIFAALLRSTQNEFAGLYYIALGLTAIPTGYANAGKWLVGAWGQFIAQKVGRRIFRLIPVFFYCVPLVCLY